MTTEQYLDALKQLGLLPHGIKTREALGLSARQLARLAAGYPVNSTLERLINHLLSSRECLSHDPQS